MNRLSVIKKYPIVYIQHGVGENETGWIWQGKLNLIADNLLAEYNSALPFSRRALGSHNRTESGRSLFRAYFPNEVRHPLVPRTIPSTFIGTCSSQNPYEVTLFEVFLPDPCFLIFRIQFQFLFAAHVWLLSP